MQIDPTVIPDAAVEKFARMLVGLKWRDLAVDEVRGVKRAAADILREIIPLLAAPVEREEDC